MMKRLSLLLLFLIPLASFAQNISVTSFRLDETGYAGFVNTETISAPILSAVPVKLTTTAAKPTITIDGQVITALSDITSLAIGNHTIFIFDPDCYPYTKTFTVTKDGTNVFTFEPELLVLSEMTITVNGVSFKMIPVPGGSFHMGATSEQGSDENSNSMPVHKVTLNSFFIGETEVTQELWQAVMGNNPSNFTGKGLQCPVEHVTWIDCKSFIFKLNSLTGKNFRLPTEAEWEFAARGGNKSRGYKYSGSDNPNSVAWYRGNSGKHTHPVKKKKPNELGIYDMSGNVWEYCSDWWGAYSSDSVTNPKGPSIGQYPINRGGSYYSRNASCRVSKRNLTPQLYRDISLGFRLAL